MQKLENYLTKAKHYAYSQDFSRISAHDAAIIAWCSGFEDAVKTIAQHVKSSCKQDETKSQLKEWLEFLAENMERTVDYEKAVRERIDTNKESMS